MKIEDVRKLSSFDRLCYWIKTREDIRLKKEAGKPPPWTDDEILQTYRFCNVRRMDDAVSSWLLANWYGPYKDHPNMIAAVALARFVNKPSSLEPLTAFMFRSGVPDWENVKTGLRTLRKLGPIFNSAYMVRGNDGVDKVECVVDHYVRPLVEKTNPVIRTDSMERTWAAIIPGYGMGSFMAGQIVADLRHAITGTWADRNEWAPVGPGSSKGLAMTLYGDDWQGPAARYVSRPDEFSRDLVHELVPRLKKALPRAITDRLEAHDYQNCCCEQLKFSKAVLGIGKPKQLYRGAK